MPETASSRRRTLTLSESCFLAASSSSILSWWEANRVCTHEPPTRSSLQAGACPNRQRDAPPSCAPAWPPAGRHAQREPRPPNPGPQSGRAPPHQCHGSAPAALQQQVRSGFDGLRCPISPRQPKEDSGPVLGPCTLPNPEAEAGSRRGPRLLRAKTSNPPIIRCFTASGTCSHYGGNTRGSQRHGRAYVEANPRPQCRAHATRFGRRRLRFAFAWIGSGAASGTAACSRLRHLPSAAGLGTGGPRLRHSARGCNAV